MESGGRSRQGHQPSLSTPFGSSNPNQTRGKRIPPGARGRTRRPHGSRYQAAQIEYDPTISAGSTSLSGGNLPQESIGNDAGIPATHAGNLTPITHDVSFGTKSSQEGGLSGTSAGNASELFKEESKTETHMASELFGGGNETTTNASDLFGQDSKTGSDAAVLSSPGVGESFGQNPFGETIPSSSGREEDRCTEEAPSDGAGFFDRMGANSTVESKEAPSDGAAFFDQIGTTSTVEEEKPLESNQISSSEQFFDQMGANAIEEKQTGASFGEENIAKMHNSDSPVQDQGILSDPVASGTDFFDQLGSSSDVKVADGSNGMFNAENGEAFFDQVGASSQLIESETQESQLPSSLGQQGEEEKSNVINPVVQSSLNEGEGSSSQFVRTEISTQEENQETPKSSLEVAATNENRTVHTIQEAEHSLRMSDQSQTLIQRGVAENTFTEVREEQKVQEQANHPVHTGSTLVSSDRSEDMTKSATTLESGATALTLGETIDTSKTIATRSEDPSTLFSDSAIEPQTHLGGATDTSQETRQNEGERTPKSKMFSQEQDLGFVEHDQSTPHKVTNGVQVHNFSTSTLGTSATTTNRPNMFVNMDDTGVTSETLKTETDFTPGGISEYESQITPRHEILDGRRREAKPFTSMSQASSTFTEQVYDLETLKSQYLVKKKELRSCKKELALTKAELTSANSRCGILEKENEHFRGELLKLTGQLEDKLHTEIFERCKKEFDRLKQREIQHLKAELNRSRGDSSQMKDHIKTLNENHLRFKEQVKSSISSLESERDNLRLQLSQLSAAANGNSSDQNRALQLKTEEFNMVRQGHDRLQDQLREMHRILPSKDQEIRALKNQIAELQSQNGTGNASRLGVNLSGGPSSGFSMQISSQRVGSGKGGASTPKRERSARSSAGNSQSSSRRETPPKDVAITPPRDTNAHIGVIHVVAEKLGRQFRTNSYDYADEGSHSNVFKQSSPGVEEVKDGRVTGREEILEESKSKSRDEMWQNPSSSLAEGHQSSYPDRKESSQAYRQDSGDRVIPERKERSTLQEFHQVTGSTLADQFDAPQTGLASSLFADDSNDPSTGTDLQNAFGGSSDVFDHEEEKYSATSNAGSSGNVLQDPTLKTPQEFKNVGLSGSFNEDTTSNNPFMAEDYDPRNDASNIPASTGALFDGNYDDTQSAATFFDQQQGGSSRDNKGNTVQSSAAQGWFDQPANALVSRHSGQMKEELFELIRLAPPSS